MEERRVGKLDAHTIAIELVRKTKDAHAVGLVEELARLVFERITLREEAAVAVVRSKRGNGQVRVSVHVGHRRGFPLPIGRTILNDAESIDPEIAHAHPPRDLNSVSERFRKEMQRDLGAKVVQRCPTNIISHARALLYHLATMQGILILDLDNNVSPLPNSIVRPTLKPDYTP